MRIFQQKIIRSFIQAFVLLTCISIVAIPAAFAQTADEAGKVLMAIGEVKAVRKGQAIPLARGTSIQSGDTLITGIASNAQVRMSDGAIIALRAQTEFKIDEYKYNGKQDGSEKASLSLVKGGVRAVTGAIGQQNKDNLQVNAVVATVGIRGTGFNINYCEANCFNLNKTAAKDGLYAGVFEGQITVKNEATTDTLGVNQFLYVADKNTAPVRLSTPPNFLPDPLSGQKAAKKDKSNAAEIPSLNAAVSPPREAADEQVSPPFSPLTNLMGIVINQAPSLLVTGGFSPPTQMNWYNKTGLGDGVVLASGYTNYLQLAEVYPNSSTLVNGLPPNNIGNYVASSTPSNPNESPNPSQIAPITSGTGFQVTNSGTSQTQITLSGSYGVVNPATGLPYVVPTSPASAIPVNYQIGTAQQMEGGNYNGVVSWGRWANGTMYQVAAYGYDGTPGSYINAVNLPEKSGFHYVVGQVFDKSSVTTPSKFTFNLLGATTPTAVSNPQGSWFVTGGTLTANLGTPSPSISGNLAMFTSQPAGYGNYNMAFSGSGSASLAQTPVTTTVTKTNGTLATCSGGCSGNGNVVLYGPSSGPKAAGLSYNFNTGANVVQGVAVFKR